MCRKVQKENTQGDERYCQGHSKYDQQIAENANKDYKESLLEKHYQI